MASGEELSPPSGWIDVVSVRDLLNTLWERLTMETDWTEAQTAIWNEVLPRDLA